MQNTKGFSKISAEAPAEKTTAAKTTTTKKTQATKSTTKKTTTAKKAVAPKEETVTNVMVPTPEVMQEVVKMASSRKACHLTEDLTVHLL